MASERIKQYGLQCVEGDLVATITNSNCESDEEMAADSIIDDADLTEFTGGEIEVTKGEETLPSIPNGNC